MTTRLRRPSEGFTLVELLIAMTLSILIIGVVVTAFIVTLKSQEQTRTELGESHDTQLVSAYLPADLLSAGGATSDVDSTASTPTGCAGSPSGNLNVVRLQWSDTFGASPTYFSSAYRVLNAAGEWQLMRYSCQASTAAGLASATASTLVVAHNLKPVVTTADLPGVVLNGDQVTLTITDATGYSYVIVGSRRTPLVGATASATPSPTPSPTPLQATVQSVTLNNTDAQGNVKLVATFSLALQNACATRFTVTDTSAAARTFAGTATLDATKTVATLPLTTSDLTKANTATPGLAVSFAGDNASCTAASFTNATLSDKAAPVITNVTTTNRTGGTAGLLEAGDAMSIAFSEALSTYPNVTAVTETDPAGNGPSGTTFDYISLTATLAPFASTHLNSDSYVTQNNKSGSFSATTAQSGTSITVTTSGTCSGNGCGDLSASAGALTFTQGNGLSDAAGNALTATSTPVATGAQTVSTFTRAF